MSEEIKRGEFNSEQNQDWTPSSQPDDENTKKEKFDSTGEGGEIKREKETDQIAIVDDKKNNEEELTPEEIERAKQEKEQREKNYKVEKEEKEGIERANREIQEMDKWKELQGKGLLTEEADGILNKLLEEIIPEIEHKGKMLTMARGQVKRFKARIDKGGFDKGGIRAVPERRNINPTIDLEEREIGMKKLEMDYTYSKERLRELKQEKKLEKKIEQKNEEINEEVSMSGETQEEEPEKKGILKSLKGLFGGRK